MDSKLNVKSVLNQILIEPAMILISKNKLFTTVDYSFS
jgi:hypothetical protein